MSQFIRLIILLITLIPSYSFADSLDDVAKATGGTIYHMDKANNGMVPVFQGEVAMMGTNSILMIAYDIQAQNKIYYTFSIDPTISELMVLVTSTKQNEIPKVSLVTPDQQPVANDAITINESSVIIRVKNPAVGSWNLSIASPNPVSLQIKAISTLTIESQATYTKKLGREGSDYFPNNEKLSPSESVLFQIQMRVPKNKLNQLYMAAVSEAGEILVHAEEVKLDQSGAEGMVYVDGKIIMPAQPFRIMVTGLDETGKRFQRMGNYRFNVNETRPMRVN